MPNSHLYTVVCSRPIPNLSPSEHFDLIRAKDNDAFAVNLVDMQTATDALEPRGLVQPMMTPTEAMELALDFVERSKLVLQPNSKGYFDNGQTPPDVKLKLVLAVAEYYRTGKEWQPAAFG